VSDDPPIPSRKRVSEGGELFYKFPKNEDGLMEAVACVGVTIHLHLHSGRPFMSRSGGSWFEKWARGRMVWSCTCSRGSCFAMLLKGIRSVQLCSSAADEISGETVAIKLVTRVFEKVQLAKRALREITLLRHFNHENITGLIDVDAITPDFNEMSVACSCCASPFC
jgi:serine/threonine protein kinase